MPAEPRPDEPTHRTAAATADPAGPAPQWYRISGHAVAERLGVDPSVGLSAAEVAERVERYGTNELAEAPRRPAWLRFVDQFNDLLVFILIGAAVVSAAVGDLKDPIVIAIVLLINAVLGYVQESRADDALAALQQMLEVIVRVRRDGAVLEVPARELVPGDIVLMEAGDRVPADGRFLVASSLSVDESTLTGESVPVDKTADVIEVDGDEVALAERANCGYMNTTLTRGRAEMVVTATGMETEVGRLAGLLSAADDQETPLQQQLDKLGKRLALIAGIAVLAVFLVGLSQGDEIGEAVLGAVALAVAAIPEGLPAVVTVTLAIGVSRMAKERAIVKRLASVETLGSTTVICSDKTGTLTLNQMTATRVVAAGRTYEFEGLGYGDEGEVRAADGAGSADDDTLRWALTTAVLCNDAHIRTGDDGSPQLVGDPTEGALVVAARKVGLDPEALRADAPRLDEVPFDSAVKYMATLHPLGDEGSLLVVKGAPDVVLSRCDRSRVADGTEPLDAAGRERAQAANDELGRQGLRVLAVASKVLGEHHADPTVGDGDGTMDLSAEIDGLTLEALIGILDPARPEAVVAVAECAAAGIGVRMITGDHATTAGAIAAELGIPGSVVTGAELNDMSDEELAERIEEIGVCARVSPEHKVRVVKALQSNGEVVAMTGDGVNDAPSLKQAEIGVAMGITGTEVTKEAGDMILTDDNFATIVKAVERGRAIYENIVTFVRFQLTTNVAAIGTILTARLAGYPAPFNPIQILFVNILADGPPAMSLGMDPPRPGVMDREPRDGEERILSGARLVPILFTAAIMTVTIMAILVGWTDASPATSPEDDPGFTMAFTSFVFLQMVNALIVRSGDLSVFNRFSLTNRTFWLAVSGVVIAQVLVVVVPFLQNVFGTTSLSGQEWLVCVLSVLPLLVISELRTFVLWMVRRSRPPVAVPAAA
ncbi:cation-translocating P-type ATPase [Dermatobacter hominis]|uniref:cation-translocating P-type ATPase n=1 Tax=Dermatobacter hominis TaxID=2884263 RepID=UPI001D110062|nr:cation-translocating P-type ATPase [Dermatobacter hominis]UDY35430.1 cation-translocating P-type ATPase [Dermatobacter hominis]